MGEPEGREQKVRPLSTATLNAPRPRPIVGVVVAVFLVAVVAIAEFGFLSTTDSPAPVATPAVPGTAVAPPDPSRASSEPVRLGLQGESTLWAIDLTTLDVTVVTEDAVDAIPWLSTIAGRRLGDVYYLAPDGQVEVDALSGQVFAVLLIREETMALTPLPVALVPIWPGASPEGYDLVIARRALDGSEWSDVPLPGCGVPYPIAGLAADDVFAVKCANTNDLRLFVQLPSKESEEGIGEITGGHGGPASVNRRDESLIVDSTGVIWTLVLGADVSVDRSGSLQLEPGQQVPGIVALGSDGTTLLAGVATPEDLSAGRSRASQLVAYDRVLNTEIWTMTTPVPFESLAVGPDGIIYAYYSAVIGAGPHPQSALMAIDPNTGSASILISPLDLGMGRLVILSP